MTSASRRPPSNGRPASDGGSADPWWGFDDAATTAPFDEPIAATRTPSGTAPRRRRRRQRSGAANLGWLLLGLLVAPIDLLRRLLASSPRLRRWAIRMAVVLGILTVLACSVGVILINNLVIGRSAELGELDKERRELRRENALLSAKAARLSAPDVVFRRATRELGMVPTNDVPQFIYLVPGSRTLTPLQRRRVAARVQLQRERATKAAAASMDLAASTTGADVAKTPTDTAAPNATSTKGDG